MNEADRKKEKEFDIIRKEIREEQEAKDLLKSRTAKWDKRIQDIFWLLIFVCVFLWLSM